MGSELEKREITGPEVADQLQVAALAAIEAVTDPDEAMRLADQVTAYEHAVRLARLGGDYERRWGVDRLRAERKAGELVGPPQSREEIGRKGGQAISAGSSSDRRDKIAESIRRSKLRSVAAVPEEAFEEYLATDPEPTRTGLLRHHETPGAGTRPRIGGRGRRVPAGTAEAVTLEAMRRIKARQPVNVRQLADQFDVSRPAAERLVGIARDRLATEARGGQWRGPSVGHDGMTNAERERKLKARVKAAADEEFLRLTKIMYELGRLASLLESIDMGAEIADADDMIWWKYEEILDLLVHVGAWVDRQAAVVRGRVGDLKVRELIAKLEAIAASTPYEGEAAAMRERAAKLRRENRLE